MADRLIRRRGVALADLPMAEFWTAGIGGINAAVPASARAAGKTVVGAEAFTGRPEVSQFTEDPAFLKTSADKVFAQGINRMILHHWVHQPFDERYQPGMGMGWWGTHFGRNQTWFEPGKAFLLTWPVVRHCCNMANNQPIICVWINCRVFPI